MSKEGYGGCWLSHELRRDKCAIRGISMGMVTGVWLM